MAKKIGLALGAGSTKGFAHIGVLQQLEEEGIQVDMVSGSSMGAIIGSIYSVGTDLNMLEKLISTMNIREYMDVSFPLTGGLLKGEKIQELVRVLTHNKSFEQTRIPFCCVAVDANNGKLDVLDHGMLHEAVRASMSIPAIFEPMLFQGKTYIDGGVLERVPCKCLRDRGADVVIGVDVGYHGDPEDVTGMNAYQLMNRMISIMVWEMTKLRREEADLMLVPEVLFVKGRFQNDQAGDCVEEGRRVVKENIDKIKELIK